MIRYLIAGISAAGFLIAATATSQAQPVKLDSEKMRGSWPADMQVVAIRIGRPTEKMDENRRFYVEGLRLKVLGEFQDHEGFSGLFVGLPNQAIHLEFTSQKHGSPGAAPSKDNNLVLYMQDREQIAQVAKRLAEMGFKAVKAENPYWNSVGAVTVPDPDGWNVVLSPHLPAMMAKCCEIK